MLINKKYLDKETIKSKIIELNDSSPISYLIFDNFIDEDFYLNCMNDLKSNDLETLSLSNRDNSNNKSIFVKGEYLSKLDKFLSSKVFEKYLSIYFLNPLKREFYIDRKKIGYTDGIIAQLYENGDYYGWHIDGSDKGISLGAFTYYLGGYSSDKNNFSSGGELELGDGYWGNINSYKEIFPINNRLVLLLYSKTSFHRVKNITCDNFKRISIQATLLKDI